MKLIPYSQRFFFLIGLFYAFFNFESLFAQVGTPLVIVIPDTSNNYAEYQIYSRINAGGQGASNNLEINNDTIYVEFDVSTGVPSSISSSYISVNGSGLSGTANVRGQLIAIPTPVAITNDAGQDSIKIIISASAEIRNPTVSGDHTLFLWTTGQHDDTPVESDSYSIYQSTSTVTSAAVTPNPSIAGLAAAYTIGFNVGSGGSLMANVSTISIAFDTSTTIPTGSISGVTVNGTSANAVADSDTVVVTTPVDIDNDGSVQVVFASGAGIYNPPIDGNYVLAIRTSTETTFVESDSFSISPAGQLSISAITTRPDTVNQSGAFGFDLVTGSTGELTANTDSFIVIFQQNTYLPANMSKENVTISSGGNSDIAYAISVQKTNSADDDTVYIVTPFAIGNEANVSILLSSAAGYQNPSIAGNYMIKLETSAETTPVASNPFSVFATSTDVSQALVTPSNITPGQATTYTVDFNLGRLGRLKRGTSTITLTFPIGFSLSPTASDYDSSYITIAGGTPIQLDQTEEITVNTTNRTITVTLPPDAVNQNNSNIVLHFGGNHPITNPAAGNYQIDVRTSVETSNVKSSSFNIGGTAITINSITRGNSTVNSPSSYTFNIYLENNLSKADADYITIVFPAGTILPDTILTQYMTISGSVPAVVTVNKGTRTVTATVDQNVNAYQGQNPIAHDIIISSGANIINPAVPSETFYKYTLSTSRDQQQVTSNAYPLYGSANSVSSVSATASPAVINATNVAYTVSFTTSAIGKLVGGASAGSSTITVDFDTATTVPSTIAAGNVEINSTPLSSVTVDTVGKGGTVTLTMPNGLTIGNNSNVNVLFKSILGFSNGSRADTYNLTVKTSSDTVYSDTTGTEGDYTFTAAQNLTFTSVTPTPSTQNANASYSIRFTSGTVDTLNPGDSIRVVFPYNTYLPPTLSTNDLTINGSNPATITTQGDTLTVTLALGDTVFALDEVTVLINQAAGILNPTTVQSYTLKVITSAEPGPFTSPSYNITQTSTTVSAATVTPSPVTPGAGARYTVNFNVGAGGRLIAGTSTITVTFNASTTVVTTAGNYDSTYITVDGSTVQIPAVSISASGKAVTMTIPSGVSIDNNDAVSLLIHSTTGPIVNPGTTGDYTLQVKTSVETSNIISNTYTITSAGPVTNITVNVTTNAANAESEYFINFRVQNIITYPGGTITITFPSNTLVPSSIAVGAVQIAHGSDPTNFQSSASVSTNPSTRAVTIGIWEEIGNTDSVRVRFLPSAGIENPSIAQDYSLNTRTSSQNVNGTSAAYTIGAAGTTIQNLTLTITPPTASVNGEYEYHFITGTNGRLVSGSSKIFLVIPDDAEFTQGTPSTSRVTVNATAAQALELRENTSDNDTLLVTIPSSVTIGNMTSVTVIIDVNAGLQNASDYGSRIYEVYTSVEGSASLDMSLPVELTSFSLESNNGKVFLNWVTESELENAYWMIQRVKLSKDEYDQIVKGELYIEDLSSSFEIIDYVDAKGSVSVETNYSYVDSLVSVGNVYGYRLADVSYSGVITFHEILFQEISAPEAFKLYNNYPNPFNPVTTIKYSLPVDANVELKIFNLLGQEVTNLVNDMEKAGFHYVQWNGTSRSGNILASGVYFVYMQATGAATNQQFHQVMKIVLLK